MTDMILNRTLFSDKIFNIFLKMVFEHIVLGHFNMELIEPAAECFFLLICCHQEEYLKLANNLIAKQHVTNETFKQRLIDAFQVSFLSLIYLIEFSCATALIWCALLQGM